MGGPLSDVALDIALPVAAGIAVVGSAVAGWTDGAFWLAASLFASSAVALLASSSPPVGGVTLPESWRPLPTTGLVMVAFCSGVWVLAAALAPRTAGGEPPAVPSGAAKAAAALVLLVAAVFSIPMGAYLSLEVWCAARGRSPL